jgi:hypothetical protein
MKTHLDSVGIVALGIIRPHVVTMQSRLNPIAQASLRVP